MKITGPRGIAVLALAGTTLFAAPSLANGRFPRAQKLVEGSRDAQKLVIAATYGLLTSEDHGRHWYHVCDAAFSLQVGFASDPVIGQTADDSLLMGVQQAITVSHDHGCDWSKVSAAPMPGTIDDFAMFPSDRNDIIAINTTYDGGSATTVRLQESRDGGLTWAPIGIPVPVALAYTIDVDPTNRNRIYVTGTQSSSDPNDPGLFLVSTDRGASWTSRPIPGTSIRSSPWIAAIHPRDGNKIFVRTDNWKSGTNTDNAGDALLYSSDGGVSWTELLHAGGQDVDTPGAKLLAFALSPDGSTAVAGYGDINDLTRVVDPEGRWLGVYKSASDGSYSFGSGAPEDPVPTLKTPVSCLTWSKSGIYACLNPVGQPQYLGFSADASLTPSSMTTLMNVQEVLGVPPSCSGRAVSTCTWSTDCYVLGACDAGPPPNDPPQSDAGKAEGGTSGSGGAGGNGPAANPPSSSGCSVPIAVPSSAPSSSGMMSSAMLVVALAVNQRRRARRC